MKFDNKDRDVTADEIASAEAEIGIKFPEALRTLFLENNGGDPDPYVFESEMLQTAVSETLPLFSSEGRGTALDTYRNLVLGKQIVPKKFFPFAVDPGGDYFFVDCSNAEGTVYFFRSDIATGEHLENLGLSLDLFWKSLVEEE
jgi:cell wall assembly regulator SMI1